MKRLAFCVLTLPLLMFGKEVWNSGVIKVIDTNEWCGRPGIPDWPGVCGPIRGDTMALFNDNTGAPHPATPYSQVLEIDAPDAVYVIRRTSLDGGLTFSPGAKAQFAVEGKHLLIKFDRQVTNRQGEVRLVHDHDRTDILEVRKP